MKFHFIGDTHFNHNNIIKYCNRPFKNVEEMNEHIIKQWNSVVKKDDTVYHLGDFALKSDQEMITDLVKRLNGSIILILGNHDKFGKQKFLDCGFKNVHKQLTIGKYILTHRPKLDLDINMINIHGHTHNKRTYLNYFQYINVSCELINYTPINKLRL